MDKSLLLAVGGVKGFTLKLNGEEHEFFTKAKTPEQIACYYGNERRSPETEEGDKAQNKFRAEFIASALCDENGTLSLTTDEAMQIPVPLKVELCLHITRESNRVGDAGKRSPPRENSGSGTSSP